MAGAVANARKFPAQAKTANPLEGASPVRGGTLEIPRSMSTRLPPSLRTNDLVEVWHGGEKLFYREGFRIPRKFMNRWAGNTEFDCGSTFILSFYVLEKLILVRYERIWPGRVAERNIAIILHPYQRRASPDNTIITRIGRTRQINRSL